VAVRRIRDRALSIPAPSERTAAHAALQRQGDLTFGRCARSIRVDGAEVGHLDQHGERGGFARAEDAREDGEAGLQGGIGGKLGGQGGVDRGDLAVDLPQALLT
jgi:hypothetical protein